MWFVRNNVTKELNYNDNNIKYRTSFYNAKHLHHRLAGPARIVGYGDATIYAEIYFVFMVNYIVLPDPTYEKICLRGVNRGTLMMF